MGQRMTRRQVDEGLELYAQKNYDAAIKKWTTALPKMKDNRLRFSTLGHLASASRDRGRNKDYLLHAVQQIDIAHELDDNVLRAQAYLNLSRANEMLADYFKAVSYSRLAIQYSQTTDSIQGYALLAMADSYIGLCNFPKVLECLDKALSISHENEDHLMEIQVLNTMGKVFLVLKDFPKALAFQRRAHELALSNAAYAGEQSANTSAKFVRLTKLKLATPLRLMGDLQGATKCVEEAMRSASSLGDRPVQAKCLASEILTTALSTATSMGNKLMQARCHLLNERILAADNQLEDARQAFEIAQRLYREIDLICTICNTPMGMHPDQIQILTCTHVFHERCILNLLQRWTYEAQSCPKCNKSVLYSRSYIALSLF
ncbi:unnamed protein product [Rotaria sp. Silwood2]|nr:unnamed protein product [Rotaria sp. Silwood2]CAF2659466.1 unnamed protein product [Rotaria sp. Silwood2]CAF2874635.1 unnamed protein product [Rotaria sp. Silwood2]CAF3067173.1 unnamed protein product [Rotaria sp. Silwood2]CAF3939166.1 unnamed protein product [Rotaria sp. Silwood2]